MGEPPLDLQSLEVLLRAQWTGDRFEDSIEWALLAALRAHRAACGDIQRRVHERLAWFDTQPKGVREVSEPLERTLSNLSEIVSTVLAQVRDEP